MDPKCLIPGDAMLIENIVNYLKAKGIFDEFRHECLADVDTKSSCQNLSQRVDGYASKFLGNETWHPDLNKNELRNKLRRHIDEAGFLAPGAGIVVEQAINPKVYHYFLPKVIEVVHQYVKEQTEILNKKPETVSSFKSSSISEKLVNDLENKDKTQISDPIADILSFSFNTKTENAQHKHGDTPKVEKKKEEKYIPTVEKNIPETQTEALITPVNEIKIQLEREKDKIKKEDPEIQPEVIKKIVKDEVRSEKKKVEDVKLSISEITTQSEESKSSMSSVSKSNVSSKRDDKNKHKSKSQNVQKMPSSSNEMKKPKKESSEKSSDKLNKVKSMKSSKESLSPTKISSSHKSAFKEEKGESSKTKSHDISSSKTSESSVKKSKSNYDKKDSSSSKHRGHSEKNDKFKASKSVDKNEHHIHHDSSNSEKSSKNIQYSSSYDSSQGSDQEKSASTNTKKEKSKHFSKHVTKEKPEQSDNSNKTDKKRSNHSDENPSKKYKNEKDVKLKLKDASAVEAAKISSRSNSFGSTSSVSSASNASKDNLTSNSDEMSENSMKDKKKKQAKEKDSCQNSPKTLPPPPPPPPPSNSLTSEVTSSAEMSSVEDTQSSISESDASSSDVISEESGSDLELECKDLINDTLNENALNSSTDNINAFYDIFLYSSSSSEFEGYGNSPEKKYAFENELDNMHESDVSISSVHTSDLSSFDDELSSDDDVALLTGGLKKRLSLKEAQELIENKASLIKNETSLIENEASLIENEASLIEKNKVISKPCVGDNSFNEGSSQKSSSVSDDESPPSEPVRLLRRERKLNPRYSSSEYTSIFNCKKETFITKQSSPSVKSQTSPKTETNLKKTDLSTENKLVNKKLTQDKIIKAESDEVKLSDKNKCKLKKESQNESDQLKDNKMLVSDEAEAIIDKEKLFKENNKNNLITDDDKLKDHKKLRPYNNSKVRRNSHSLKRKLEITESTPVKRPCSRSSIDSSSSEFTPNENKPFNSEKKDLNEEKKLNECGLKVSNLNIDVKKDLFNKQRTNNNGDILGQKDIFSKNSHSKVINNEKKTSESDTSNELNSL